MTFTLIRCANECGRRFRSTNRGGFRYCPTCTAAVREARRLARAEERRRELAEHAAARHEANQQDRTQHYKPTIIERLRVIDSWMRESA